MLILAAWFTVVAWQYSSAAGKVNEKRNAVNTGRGKQQQQQQHPKAKNAS